MYIAHSVYCISSFSRVRLRFYTNSAKLPADIVFNLCDFHYFDISFVHVLAIIGMYMHCILTYSVRFCRDPYILYREWIQAPEDKIYMYASRRFQLLNIWLYNERCACWMMWCIILSDPGLNQTEYSFVRVHFQLTWIEKREWKKIHLSQYVDQISFYFNCALENFFLTLDACCLVENGRKSSCPKWFTHFGGEFGK